MHRFAMAFTYAFAIWLSYKFLSMSDAQINTITLISSGAILATFGSAISAIAATWTSDLLETFHFNIDVLFRDILKNPDPWKRWPFLERHSLLQLSNGNTISLKLNNPKIPFILKDRTVEIDVPSMTKDLYDLSVLKNLIKCTHHRSSALLAYTDKDVSVTEQSFGMNSSDSLMAYLCLHDIWKSAFKFRMARYLLHFGSALTIAGSLLTVVLIFCK